MFSNLFPPVVSGSSTQSSALARELVRRGHSVTVITTHLDKTTARHEVVDGVEIHRLPCIRVPPTPLTLNFPWVNLTFTPANQRRIQTIVRQHRPDVLHVHNHIFDLGLSASRMSRRMRIPMVLTIHTILKHPNPALNAFLSCADRLAARPFVVARASAILCPDQNVVIYMANAYKRPNEPIVPYGVEGMGSASPALVAHYREKHRLEGRRVILSLGHIHEIRNRRDLVEAMPFVLERLPDALLLIVGEVATRTPGELARKLGVEDSVVFAGTVPHAHISALFELAVLEAHWGNQEAPDRTSLGIASLEAMAAGKTILAAANPNTYGEGLLRSGENLVIVEPGKPRELANTIVQLLEDPIRRQTIGENARRTIRESFSWDAVCMRTVDVYRNAIGGSA
jgi:glycosyltransferase involved in cell wall biosynthesis